MNVINFIGGEKGGVGKSVVSRLLAQYYIDNDENFVGYDTDRSHHSFLRFYTDYASPTSIDSYESLDKLIESLESDIDNRIIVDLAAQTNLPLRSWLEDSGVVELAKELQIQLKFWHVMDDSKDSLLLLEELVEKYRGLVSYVIVLNHGRGSDFKLFENSNIKQELNTLQANTIHIKKLYESTMQKIDANNTSFWAACNNKNNSIGLLERQRIKTWLHNTYKQFETLGI
ncbi:MAG: mobilization protein [Spirochaetota bacterium]